jgi:putative copper export protein
MHSALLLIHVLSATIWTGGHLVLAFRILPRVMRNKSPGELLQFESAYETLGMPALLVQIGTGLWMAFDFRPEFASWFRLDDGPSVLIMAKLALLALTGAIAMDARLRIVPHLSEDNLPSMARHIAAVTALSVLFVVVGVSFRTGWLT